MRPMPLAFSRKAVTAAVVDAPGEAEHPRKQTWARWNRLAAVNKEVVAPLTGGHRNTDGGEDQESRGGVWVAGGGPRWPESAPELADAEEESAKMKRK